MQVGIIGMPNAGKTTLFNAVTRVHAVTDMYPFTTIEPNIGMVEITDNRLARVQQIAGSKQMVPANIRFMDVAGLVKGASKGEGLGNKFLSHIRDADVLVHVVRCFSSDTIAHVEGRISPAEDIETIDLELMLADLSIIDRRITELERRAKTGDKEAVIQHDLLAAITEKLDKGIMLRPKDMTDEQKEHLKDVPLLTLKPVIFVANVGEGDTFDSSNPLVREVEEKAKQMEAGVIALPVEIEEEISELDEAEAVEFLKDMGLEESPLLQLVHAVFKLLGLITFFTANPNEAHAWNIPEGTTARKAAGKVHTDMERGFIKAEVVAFGDLDKAGSMHAAKEHGHWRLEGKEYVVKDGDVIYFRFAV